MLSFVAPVAIRCLLIAGAFAAAGGCASLRKYAPAPESLSTCRSLSRDGVAALERGDGKAACELLEQAVSADPRDVDARRQLAEALWNQGQYAAAADMIESAVTLDPTHAPTLVRAGEMLHETGVVVSALHRANQAIAIDGTLAAAWALRGRLYRGQSQPERAMADLHQALCYSPHDASVLLDVAELQYQLGRPQRCLASVHHLLDSYGPGDEPQRALWLEGLAYSAVNRPADAAASLLAATQRGPANADLMFQLAKAQAAAGQSETAANTVQHALALDAGHQPSRVLMAELTAAAAKSPDGMLRR